MIPRLKAAGPTDALRALDELTPGLARPGGDWNAFWTEAYDDVLEELVGLEHGRAGAHRDSRRIRARRCEVFSDVLVLPLPVVLLEDAVEQSVDSC